MSEERGRERRQFVRYKLKATADVVFEDGVQEKGEIDNISTGGMFLNLKYSIPEDLRDKSIRASIHAVSSGGKVTVNAGCSIVRIEPTGVALFFASIDNANRSILHELIGELNDLVRNARY